MDRPLSLKPSGTSGSSVMESEPGIWRLEIPAGPQGKYRLAQLDDYTSLSRGSYLWHPPFSLHLKARASSRSIPGTWGFGLWNDPFGMGIIKGVDLVRLPALPNAAWYFHASPHNYLSVHDDIPGNGWLAATFRSPKIPTFLLPLAAPGLLLAPFKPGMRLLRKVARRIVHQSAKSLDLDPVEWHVYQMEWTEEAVTFHIDGDLACSTPVSPRGPLGLVIWVDNQFAALHPNGEIKFGTLENPDPAWIEVEVITLGGSQR